MSSAYNVGSPAGSLRVCVVARYTLQSLDVANDHSSGDRPHPCLTPCCKGRSAAWSEIWKCSLASS